MKATRFRVFAIAALGIALRQVPLVQAQDRAAEPFEGLKSVALKADMNWHEAHVRLRTLTGSPDNTCSEAVRGALAMAKAALEERTRAWNEFYSKRDLSADDSKKAMQELIAKNDEEVSAQEKDIAQWTEVLNDLKRKREALGSAGNAGLGQNDLAKAKAEQDDLIQVRESSISTATDTITELHKSSEYARATINAEGDQSALVYAYRELIAEQSTLYNAMYRSQETRLGLECKLPDVVGPPAPPAI
jgi:hypothetical protein